MLQMPMYIPVVFIATTLLTLFFLYKSHRRPIMILVIAALWLLVQAGIALTGFYQNTRSLPPRFILALGPPLLAIGLLFLTRAGRRYLDSLDIRWLTALHVVRIPVELVLFWLFLQGQVPRLMTFEGINYDILSGITALVVAALCFRHQQIRKTPLLIWNILCLTLLFNIVIHAVLSAPLPFQRFAFDQPNVAVLYFPYVWLPAFIVPAVLLAHLAAIRQLVRRSEPAFAQLL